MFKDLTVESIKSDIISRLSSDIDTREGSYTNDMISAVAYEVWKAYQSLNAMIPIAFVDETSGSYIDKRCAEYGITRKAGNKATVILTITGSDGVTIPAGKIFATADGYQFSVTEDTVIVGGTASVLAEAASIGEVYNVAAGTIIQQFVSTSGITSVINDAPAMGGTDAETDAALVKRLYDYLRTPPTSGNAAHYKQWALETDGVGDAKVYPTWQGPGTVKVLIVGDNSDPVDQAVVTACAEHIESSRPIGATVTVQSAEGLQVNISATVILDSTVTVESVQQNFTAAVKSHLSEIAFKKYEIIYNRIVYMLLGIDGVTDYTSLTINGGTSNITIGDDQVPVVGTIEVISA